MLETNNAARRITRTLFFTQVAVSAGLIIMATINSIAGMELSGRASWAGIPAAVFLLSAAAGALIWGILMERAGRRRGLLLGVALGAVGTVLAGGAVNAGSFYLFLGGLVLVGLAQAAMALGRYAAGDVHPTSQRGRAISNVVFGGAVGAILGPLLVAPTGKFASNAGMYELAGPYAGALVLFILAVSIIYIWLRPEPAVIAQKISREPEEITKSAKPARRLTVILSQPAVFVAVTAMVISQLVMVMLMVITSLYMKGHGNSLGEISLVFSAHTFGMYAFSVFSGRLADRIGREAVIVIGAVTLMAACLMSTLPPTMFVLLGALFGLGLGWNFCFVGGSTLLADQLSPPEQPRIQGFSDLLVGLASAVGSLLSGVIFASLGYAPMGLIGAVLALVPLSLAFLRWRRGKRCEIVSA
jgi:MFS family permease